MSQYTPDTPQQESSPLPSQSSYPYPSQQWQQQPYGQSPQKPPRKKRSRRFWITAGIIVLVLALIGGIIEATGSGNPSPSSTASQATQPAQQTSVPATKPTQPPKSTPTPNLYKVGEAVPIDSVLIITLTSTKTMEGNGISTSPDEYFLHITFKAKNTSNVEQPIGYNWFTMRDVNGNKVNRVFNKYDPTSVAAGQTGENGLDYVILHSVHTYILTFTTDKPNVYSVSWQIKV